MGKTIPPTTMGSPPFLEACDAPSQWMWLQAPTQGPAGSPDFGDPVCRRLWLGRGREPPIVQTKSAWTLPDRVGITGSGSGGERRA